MNDDFSELKIAILSDIKDLKTVSKELRDKHDKDHDRVMGALSKVRIEIATLKIKASLWGAMAGMVPALCAAIVWYIVRTK
ncbi:MAG: hypothetical protein IID18_00250 [Nitrospinae bacterium]|nr:hypothetical protein [Nitrospinota bacterium]